MAISERNKEDILTRIVEIVVENGLKATTMDLVAARLGISKRTLYEIFDSKTQMLRETLEYIGKSHRKNTERIFLSSANVMEGMVKVFLYHHEELTRVNVDFFRDMDSFCSDMRREYDRVNNAHHRLFIILLKRGVREEVFRKDVDFRVMVHLMGIQFESLKRMEEHFPPDITLSQASSAIIIGFLRSIASPKGMKLLDDILSQNNLLPSANNLTL